MIIALKFFDILIATSIFFVWVIRYQNIVVEFKEYQLPDWLRDLTGIFKMSFALTLVLGLDSPAMSIVGSVGIALLMACAQAVHLRSGTTMFKRLPSLALLSLSIMSAYFTINGR